MVATFKKRFLSLVCLLMAAIVFSGCPFLEIAMEAADETARGQQERYGGSPNYQDSEVGQTLDDLSGYERVAGKIHYYNRTGFTIRAWWGQMQPNSDLVQGAYVAVLPDIIYNVQTGQALYEFEHGPNLTGRIVVFKEDKAEIR